MDMLQVDPFPKNSSKHKWAKLNHSNTLSEYNLFLLL